MSVPIHRLIDLAETCVFDKQSPDSFHCDPNRLCERQAVTLPARAPLIPKLRGYFAEFLNVSSLKRLRILTPPTCVGLRYGRLNSSLEVFLGSMGSSSLCPEGLPIASRSICCPDLPRQPPAGLDLAIQSEDTLPFCVTPSLKQSNAVPEY